MSRGVALRGRLGLAPGRSLAGRRHDGAQQLQDDLLLPKERPLGLDDRRHEGRFRLWCRGRGLRRGRCGRCGRCGEWLCFARHVEFGRKGSRCFKTRRPSGTSTVQPTGGAGTGPLAAVGKGAPRGPLTYDFSTETRATKYMIDCPPATHLATNCHHVAAAAARRSEAASGIESLDAASSVWWLAAWHVAVGGMAAHSKVDAETVYGHDSGGDARPWRRF